MSSYPRPLRFKQLYINHWIAKPDILYSYRIEKQGYKYVAKYSHVYPPFCKSLGTHFAMSLAQHACVKHREEMLLFRETPC